MWQLCLLVSLSSAAAPAPVADEGKPLLVSPKRLIEAFLQNEAFADERYVNKIIHVRGKVLRIRARIDRHHGPDEKVAYLLHLDTEGAGSNRDSVDQLFLFIHFMDDHRKALAALNPGDIVTVKGRCRRRGIFAGGRGGDREVNGGKDFYAVMLEEPVLVPKKEGAGREP